MSEAFILLPLDDSLVDWLGEFDIVAPSAYSSRHPSPRELLAAAELPGYCAVPSGPTPLGSWHIQVSSLLEPSSSPWAFLTVQPFTDMDTPSSTTFERGWPEVILPLALALQPFIGPFVIQSTSGSTPLLIAADTTYASAYEQWCADE